MAKKKNQPTPTKSCSYCIHEHACVMWTTGGRLSESNATRCPNYETAKDSTPYFIGRLDAESKLMRCRDCTHAEIYGERVVCLRAPGAAFTTDSFCSEGVRRE